jgi:hypothetical protein
MICHMTENPYFETTNPAIIGPIILPMSMPIYAVLEADPRLSCGTVFMQREYSIGWDAPLPMADTRAAKRNIGRVRA